MVAQIALIVLALLITFLILRIRKKRAFFDKDDDTAQVKFDDKGIELIESDGHHSVVLWQDLTLIAIKTTDQGPAYPDLFWQFYSRSEEPAISFPQGTIGDEDLLAFIPKKLTGFDYQQVINAMGSTDNALFVIWSKPY